MMEMQNTPSLAIEDFMGNIFSSETMTRILEKFNDIRRRRSRQSVFFILRYVPDLHILINVC